MAKLKSGSGGSRSIWAGERLTILFQFQKDNFLLVDWIGHFLDAKSHAVQSRHHHLLGWMQLNLLNMFGPQQAFASTSLHSEVDLLPEESSVASPSSLFPLLRERCVTII